MTEANSYSISIPDRQLGSSIMPGKINPVIPEFVISAAHKIYANDQLISSLAAQGCLELNAYLPVIGCSLIESINLLNAMDSTLQSNLFRGLTIHLQESEKRLFYSPSVTTALIPFIGYNKASELAKRMKSGCLTIFEANEELGAIENDRLTDLLKPENLLKLGYTLQDLVFWNK